MYFMIFCIHFNHHEHQSEYSPTVQGYHQQYLCQRELCIVSITRAPTLLVLLFYSYLIISLLLACLFSHCQMPTIFSVSSMCFQNHNVDSGVASAETFRDQPTQCPSQSLSHKTPRSCPLLPHYAFMLFYFSNLFTLCIPLQEDLIGTIYQLMQSNLKCLAQNIHLKKHSGWWWVSIWTNE